MSETTAEKTYSVPSAEWGGLTGQLHEVTGERVKANTIGGSNLRDDDDESDATRTQPSNQEAEVLPSGLKESFALLKTVQDEYDQAARNVRNKDGRQKARVIEKRLDRIKAHVFRMQQGSAVVPPMDANQQAKEVARRNAAPQHRDERIAHLKQLLETNSPAVLPAQENVPVFDGMTPHRLATSPRGLALLSEHVKCEITDCVRAFREYEILRLEMEVHLDPVLAEELARRKISQAKTPDEINAARTEYTQATEGRKGQAGAEAKDSARQMLLRAGHAPKAALIELFQAVEVALSSELYAAKFIEGEFFMQFGMRWQQTKVSERIAKALAEVNQFLAGLTAPPHHSHVVGFNPNSSPLATWLGVRYDQ